MPSPGLMYRTPIAGRVLLRPVASQSRAASASRAFGPPGAPGRPGRLLEPDSGATLSSGRVEAPSVR